MRNRPGTLDPMDLAQLDRILVRVLEVIDDQGGGWDATEAILYREFEGESLDNALAYALSYLIVYAEPGGPAFLRGMRDRRLIPVVSPSKWRVWDGR